MTISMLVPRVWIQMLGVEQQDNDDGIPRAYAGLFVMRAGGDNGVRGSRWQRGWCFCNVVADRKSFPRVFLRFRPQMKPRLIKVGDD